MADNEDVLSASIDEKTYHLIQDILDGAVFEKSRQVKELSEKADAEPCDELRCHYVFRAEDLRKELHCLHIFQTALCKHMDMPGWSL